MKIKKYNFRKKRSSVLITLIYILSFGVARLMEKYIKKFKLCIRSFRVNEIFKSNCVELDGELYDLLVYKPKGNIFLKEFETDGFVYILDFKGYRKVFSDDDFIDLNIENLNFKKKLINHNDESYNEARFVLFGLNQFNIKVQDLLDVIEDAVLNMGSIWSILAIYVWFNCDYVFYAKISVCFFIISIMYEILIGYQDLPLLNKKNNKSVEFLKNNDWGNEKSSEFLLPGDIIKIKCTKSFPVDLKVKFGKVLISEPHLTGESKSVLKEPGDFIYAGSKIINSKYADSFSVGYVMRIGGSTRKMRLYSEAFCNKTTSSEFFSSVMNVYKNFMYIGIIILPTLFLTLYKKNLTLKNIIFEVLDVIITLFDPSLINTLTTNELLSKKECINNGIHVKNSSIIKEAGYINSVIFDKTGVLTLNEPILDAVVLPNGELIKDFKNSKNLIKYCLGCCHTLTDLGGDEIDVEMVTKLDCNIFDDGINRNIKFEDGRVVKILKNYPFNSFDVKQSVVLEDIDGKKIICSKGSFGSIVEYDAPKLKLIIKKYESLGYRVISLAASTREPTYIRKIDEKDLDFIGFALFNDKIHPDSVDIINELKDANANIRICTGDSIETAIAVAKECKISSHNITILTSEIILDILNKNEFLNSDFSEERSSLIDEKKVTEKLNLFFEKNGKVKFVINGELLKCIVSDLVNSVNLNQIIINEILRNTIIFARCDPTDKQMIVKLFKKLKEKVLFVGDGENDLGALAEASVSISLSKDPNSMNSDFCSSNLSSVTNLLKIGKTSLYSIYSSFLFSFFVIFIMTGTLFSGLMFKSSLSEYCNIYIDVLVLYIFPFAFSYFGKIKKLKDLNLQFNFKKAVFALAIESSVYNIIMFIVTLLLKNESTDSEKIEQLTKNSSVLYFSSYYLIIYSFVCHTNIGCCEIGIMKSTISFAILSITILLFLLFQFFYLLGIDFFNDFLGLVPLDSRNEKIIFFTMFISFFVIQLGRFVLLKTNSKFKAIFDTKLFNKISF